MTDDDALVQEFVHAKGWTPAEVTRNDHGAQLVITVRPAMSSRTLSIVVTVKEVREL